MLTDGLSVSKQDRSVEAKHGKIYTIMYTRPLSM